MRFEQESSQEYAHRVGDRVLKDVCVFDRPAVGLLELVVQLVYVFVEPFCVQSSVVPVEACILNQEKEWQLKQHLLPVCVCVCE